MIGPVLVTGVAGFIGSHLADRLLRSGYRVVGLDNFDNFYDPAIKAENIRPLVDEQDFRMVRGDIRDASLVRRIFTEYDIAIVAHLAARAGVRPSLQRPGLYQEVNIGGTINLLEASRMSGVSQFIFASSSSVYGIGARVPFNEDTKMGFPTSPYAASKASGELYCRTYHHLYNIPIKVLRFFTVYGPRQRPEMAIHLFTRMIEKGDEIPLYGDGTTQRDYTYIEDIIDGAYAALTSRSRAFETLNLGNSNPVSLSKLVQLIEKSLGKEARIKKLPLQPGDVPITCADIRKAGTQLGYNPKVTIEEGIDHFVRWYCQSLHSPVNGLV